MNIKNCSFALFVSDINVSKDFYTRVLGLDVDLDFGKNVIFRNGFTVWEIRHDHIIPSSLGLKKVSDPTVSRFEIYFETEDLPGVLEALQRNDVKLLHGTHEETWGQRTIRFFDPDGHLIEVGESMQQFIGRFHRQGLTPEQISARTSMPQEEVRRLLNLQQE